MFAVRTLIRPVMSTYETLVCLLLQRVKSVKEKQAGKNDPVLPLWSGGLFIPLC